jgi:hypothetical protein
VEADNGSTLLVSQRPFRIGDDTAFTLPPPVAGVAWTVASGRLSASWASLPPLDDLQLFTSQGTVDSDGADSFVEQSLEVSAAYLANFGLTQIAVDTEIPGYKPEWRLDVTKGYVSSLIAEHTVNGELSTSTARDFFAGGLVGTGPGAQHDLLSVDPGDAMRCRDGGRCIHSPGRALHAPRRRR